MPNLVLPEPPGPVSVSSLVQSRRRRAEPSSRSLPTKLVRGRGTRPAATRVAAAPRRITCPPPGSEARLPAECTDARRFDGLTDPGPRTVRATGVAARRVEAGHGRWRPLANAGAHCWKACWRHRRDFESRILRHADLRRRAIAVPRPS